MLLKLISRTLLREMLLRLVIEKPTKLWMCNTTISQATEGKNGAENHKKTTTMLKNTVKKGDVQYLSGNMSEHNREKGGLQIKK